ncbi:MAG: PilN domain-containing protein [Deltaproteobacteria bacterium]|nr:PilN domain-containing protein [Deltaproteobacteria bacterium]
MVRERKITGIYLDESKLDVFCLKRQLGKWSSVEPPHKFDDTGRSLAEQVKGILQAIHPSRRRRICLALPRKNLFLRELSFPQLEPDEAANAVRMGIGLHIHLKPDEVYHDQWAFKRGDETVVLLAYIPRSFLDPVLRAVHETGHGKSLGPISPATLGLDILLRSSAEASLPCVSLGRQGDGWIITLHGVYGWEGSHSVPVSDEEDVSMGLQKLVQHLPSPFSNLAMAPVYAVGDSGAAIPDSPPKDPCSAIKDLLNICGPEGRVTWGLCAASLGLSSYPAISFQEGARHKPFRLRVKPYQFVVGAAAVAMILVSGFQGLQLQQRVHSVHKMEQEVEELQEHLSPMLNTRKQLEQIENQLKDLGDFRVERPSELEVLKAMAELTPPQTWIKNFNLKKDRLKVTAEGGSAVKTMGKWRQSPLFLEVKLISPVTKDRQQRERFTVEMKLAGGKGGASSGN